MLSAQQLPLRMPLRDEAIFDNFFAGENAFIVSTLQCSKEQFVYCYGEPGTGRTHLLQAVCHAAKPDQSIFYLPLAEHHAFLPAILESLEDRASVCLDDVDAIIGNPVWEEALFHFYNRARQSQVRLIMSAALPPQQLSFVLPDLQSRLTSGLILGLKNLSDAEKVQALKMRAYARGILLSDEVAIYIIHHYSRDMRALMALLHRCDEMSLIAKRKVTIPFIKKLLEDH